MNQLCGKPRTDIHWQSVPNEDIDLSGQRFAIVGGTGAVGSALARRLAAAGADVIVTGRTFRDAGTDRVTFCRADLSTMAGARLLARRLPAEQLDGLIFTNGILCGKQRVETTDGLEIDLAVSYLSRFVIVRELADRLGKGREASRPAPRVFVMGFPGVDRKATPFDFNSEQRYTSLQAHDNTIVGNEALVLDGATRYPNLRFYGLNPGIIKSDIRSTWLGHGPFQQAAEALIALLFIGPDTYATRTVPLLVSPDIDDHSGALFNQRGVPIHRSPSLTDALVAHLMETSARLTTRRPAPSQVITLTDAHAGA